MSLTWSWPRDTAEGEEDVEEPFWVEEAVVLVLVEWAIDCGGEEPTVDEEPEPVGACADVCRASFVSCSTLRRDDGGLCILNSGA